MSPWIPAILPRVYPHARPSTQHYLYASTSNYTITTNHTHLHICIVQMFISLRISPTLCIAGVPNLMDMLLASFPLSPDTKEEKHSKIKDIPHRATPVVRLRSPRQYPVFTGLANQIDIVELHIVAHSHISQHSILPFTNVPRNLRWSGFRLKQHIKH